MLSKALHQAFGVSVGVTIGGVAAKAAQRRRVLSTADTVPADVFCRKLCSVLYNGLADIVFKSVYRRRPRE